MPDPMIMDPDVPLVRYPRKPLPHYTTMLIPGLAIGSGLLLTCALPDLIGADGLVDYAKCALIGGMASLAAFGVNRLAAERGAVLAAVGTPGAAFVSTASILTVGLGMFAATYFGLTVNQADRLRLEEHGVAQAAYVEARHTAAMEAARVLPAVRALAAELADQAACERAASCVSGHGPGGEGPVYRALSGEGRRAEAIAAQLDAGSVRLAAGFGELGALQEAYQRSLVDESLPAQERRSVARAAIMQMGQIAGTIAQDDPVALVAGYAAELAQPSGAPAEVERLRQARAAQLHAVAAAVPRERFAPPPFPAGAGVADTLSQVGRFAPIALIVAAVDLALPVTLWLYTFFALRARLERDDPQDPAEDADRNHPTPSRNTRAKGRAG